MFKCLVYLKFYIYIKKSISYYSNGLDEIDFGFNYTSSEAVWGYCLVNDEKLLLGCLYIRGDASQEANRKIHKVFAMANEFVRKNSFSGLIISGDFNY